MALTQRSAPITEDGGLRTLDLEGLVAWIAAGHEPAVSRLYDATSGLLFGLLLLMLRDSATADEVLLDVYAEVRQRASRFNKNQKNLLIWLITIAHRCALERLCSDLGDQRFILSVQLTRPLGRARLRRFRISKSGHQRLVGATLSVLSPAEWKMIELAYCSGMTSRAIARKLRESPDTVKAGLQHGVLQLFCLFKNEGFLSEA